MKPKQVWILDEGSQGHLVQSRGLIRELAKANVLETIEIPVRCRLPRRFARSLSKRLLRACPARTMFNLLYPEVSLPATQPDLIVSSGPHSLPALEFLSKQFNCPSVFVQGSIRVPKGSVTAVMRPFEGEHRDDYIFIPLLFTEITPQVVDAAKEEYLSLTESRPAGALNTLFIGNSSAKIRFSRDDWENIARFVNEVWRNTGSQWLITTSYRTGRDLETLFRTHIDPRAVFSAVWYADTPRKVTKPFLGMGERIFVTMDSLTMLTEAVASQRPAYALCPADPGDPASNTHIRYVNHLADHGWITRIVAGHDTLPPITPPPAPDIDFSEPVRRLMEKIHWNP